MQLSVLLLPNVLRKGNNYSLSLILLECTFPGNCRFIFTFSPKGLFGFLEQINFIEIYCGDFFGYRG